MLTISYTAPLDSPRFGAALLGEYFYLTFIIFLWNYSISSLCTMRLFLLKCTFLEKFVSYLSLQCICTVTQSKNTHNAIKNGKRFEQTFQNRTMWVANKSMKMLKVSLVISKMQIKTIMARTPISSSSWKEWEVTTVLTSIKLNRSKINNSSWTQERGGDRARLDRQAGKYREAQFTGLPAETCRRNCFWNQSHLRREGKNEKHLWSSQPRTVLWYVLELSFSGQVFWEIVGNSKK